MAGYKPSMLATVTSTNLDKRKPRTQDIDLPNPSGEVDSRLIERPIGEYDKGRAKRVLSRPVLRRRS